MARSRKSALLLAALYAVVALLGVAQASPAKKDRAKPATQANSLVAVTYPVADLVVPIEGYPKGPKTNEETLLQVVSSTIDPESWTTKGGKATLQYFPVGMAVVAYQTPENHKRIAALLKDLRKLQDVEVAVEMRLVTMAADYGRALDAIAEFKDLYPDDAQRNVRGGFLKEGQVRGLMQMCQGDRRTNVMQAPKITVFNGQKGQIQVGERQEFVTEVRSGKDGNSEQVKEAVEFGLRASLVPVVTHEGRDVRLRIDFSLTSLDSQVQTAPVKYTKGEDGLERVGVDFAQKPNIRKLTLNKLLTIPAGQTFACKLGTEEVVTCEEQRVPVLSELPLVGQLFRSVLVRQQEHDVFLLVTPRIILNPDEQPVQPPPVSAAPVAAPVLAPAVAPGSTPWATPVHPR